MKKLSDTQIEQIIVAIGRQFPTFGGDKIMDGNPVSVALSKKPLMFAAGVDVRDVVGFVLAEAEKND